MQRKNKIEIIKVIKVIIIIIILHSKNLLQINPKLLNKQNKPNNNTLILATL